MSSVGAAEVSSVATREVTFVRVGEVSSLGAVEAVKDWFVGATENEWKNRKCCLLYQGDITSEKEQTR